MDRRIAGPAGAAQLLGVVVVTFTIHVPMNAAMGAAGVPDTAEAARALWLDYLPDRQVWNADRTIGDGIGLMFAALAFRRT